MAAAAAFDIGKAIKSVLTNISAALATHKCSQQVVSFQVPQDDSLSFACPRTSSFEKTCTHCECGAPCTRLSGHSGRRE